MDFSDLSRLASGHAEARIVQTAVSLGVFDIVGERGSEAAAVAASIAAEPRATELLLNALVALGLLRKENGRFSLTEVSATYLVRDSAKFFGGMILFDASLWDCWGDLEKAVRSGKSVRVPEMYQSDPQATDRFIRAMHSLVQARGDAEILAEKLDLRNVRNLLDIGSGPGTYPITLCKKFPGLRATIFDLPGTLKITERFVEESRLKDRITLLAGDYRRDPIPGRHQVVFLSNIIQGEGGEENPRLMAKLYRCLDPGGKVVIKDHILDDSLTHPPVGAIFSLLMLLTTEHGRCYSFNELRSWLEAAGFRQISQILLPYPLTSSLVIAEKGR
jgi:hypothetical protein